MYDHILGEVVSVAPARAVLRAGGVGFELQVPMGASSSLQVGITTCLYTILHVTDGNPTLLGFDDHRDRDFARMLMSVSGVGPAMSLAILSTYSVEQIADALVAGKHDLLKSVKGVGTKTAERLCLELRDKVGKMQFGDTPPAAVVLTPQSCDDAVAALTTLGYSEREAQKKVTGHHEKQPDATTEELIRSVLRG